MYIHIFLLSFITTSNNYKVVITIIHSHFSPLTCYDTLQLFCLTNSVQYRSIFHRIITSLIIYFPFYSISSLFFLLFTILLILFFLSSFYFVDYFYVDHIISLSCYIYMFTYLHLTSLRFYIALFTLVLSCSI